MVLGAFVQFYMRAGIFTDGGKKERERAASQGPRREPAGSEGPERRAPRQTPEKDELL